MTSRGSNLRELALAEAEGVLLENYEADVAADPDLRDLVRPEY